MADALSCFARKYRAWMRPAYKQHVREFVKGGRADLANHSLDEGSCPKDTRNRPSVDPNCELFPQGPIIPVPPSNSPYRPTGVFGIIRPFPQIGMQKEGLRTRGFGGCCSRHFAGGFALRRCQNSIRRYSTVSKREFRSQFPLFPLNGNISQIHVVNMVPDLRLLSFFTHGKRVVTV